MVPGVYASFSEGLGITHQVVRNRAGERVVGAYQLERYGREVNISRCLHEALGRPMQHVIGT